VAASLSGIEDLLVPGVPGKGRALVALDSQDSGRKVGEDGTSHSSRRLACRPRPSSKRDTPWPPLSAGLAGAGSPSRPDPPKRAGRSPRQRRGHAWLREQAGAITSQACVLLCRSRSWRSGQALPAMSKKVAQRCAAERARASAGVFVRAHRFRPVERPWRRVESPGTGVFGTGTVKGARRAGCGSVSPVCLRRSS
jgi:hypothetical protein